MGNESQNTYLDPSWVTDLYKFTSFISSLFIWNALYFYESDFFSHGHFATLLLAGNGFVYFSTYGLSYYLKNSGKLPFYFLFQTVCLVGMAHSHSTIEFIYSAFVPVFMSMYYFFVAQGVKESFQARRPLFLYSIAFCGLLLFETYKTGNFFNYFEVVALISFGLWTLMSSYFAFEFYFKGRKKFIAKLLNRGHKIKSSHHKMDRYFFHDIINHTHTLLLFLRSKEKVGLVQDDMHNVVNEIKLLQSGIQEHFGMNHKNLKNLSEYAPFHVAMARVYNMIDAYFPNEKAVDIKFTGHLENDDFTKLRSYKVNLIPFHRIMTNILKNAYEAGSTKINCIFDYQDDGIHITVKNTMGTLNRDKDGLDRDIGNVILNFESKFEGLGLESISELCTSCHGQFDFKIEDGQWINTVFLPKESDKSPDLRKVS